jgi:hypothetical protein
LVRAGFFPYALRRALPLVLKISAAGAMIALPVFFSGLIFSQSLQCSTDAAQALGMNLPGAAVGGALERLVMIGGSAVLGRFGDRSLWNRSGEPCSAPEIVEAAASTGMQPLRPAL